MKKVLFLLVLALSLAFGASVNAQNVMSDQEIERALASGRISYEQPQKGDVTMASFVQNWLDSKSTISIKNNTNKTIRAIKFRVVYLDMAGNQLDYSDFEQIDLLEPGMAKKLNMPAYEEGRFFSYYKSERCPGGSGQRFKVQFAALGVVTDGVTRGVAGQENVSGDTKETADGKSGNAVQRVAPENQSLLGIVQRAGVLWLLFVIGVIVGLYEIVAVMARDRHRSELGWVLVSLVATPLFAAFLLLLLGNAYTGGGDKDFADFADLNGKRDLNGERWQ